MILRRVWNTDKKTGWFSGKPTQSGLGGLLEMVVWISNFLKKCNKNWKKTSVKIKIYDEKIHKNIQFCLDNFLEVFI
jgi:hypothetical protein